MIFVFVIEIVQCFVVSVVIFNVVDLIPFVVDINPELVVPGIDVGRWCAASLAWEIFGAGGCLAIKNFLIIWIVVNELVWRSLSRQQASVYLRSTFVSWMHRDLRMIVMKRLKRKRREARKMEPVSRDKADFEDPKRFDGER